MPSDGDGASVMNWSAVHGLTTGEAVQKVSDFYPLTPKEAEGAIDAAIDAGDIVEDDSETYPRLYVPGADGEGSNIGEEDQSDVPEEAVVQCLNEILDWYHRKVDEPLPIDDCEYDTPREYYKEARRWTDETIDEKKLGYAPPNHVGELADKLLMEGYRRDEILATGLITENKYGSLQAIWNGRYVLPYTDKEGTLTFAISRATDPAHPKDWAGRSGNDDTPSKYHKIPTTSDEVVVEEPIYGLDSITLDSEEAEVFEADTVEPSSDKSVLITEGIADAITAHQRGHPCISPVTTQFSNNDMERLASVLSEYGVTRAFVVQDAERPGSSVAEPSNTMSDIHTEQFGSGVKGAVKTAMRLCEDGIETQVGELPRPGLEKVDLDDFLTRWQGDLTAVLRSAKPPSQHPASKPVKPTLEQVEQQEQNGDSPSLESDGEQSALWDLDITDVTGWAVGDRGNNPLGHHGDSEGYFKIYEGKSGKAAYDHKHKTAYNALTFILCEEGIRSAGRPGGRLTDEEVWVAWRHAKEQGYIAPDDKCPAAALKHIAVKHGVCDETVIEAGWKLPYDSYRDTLDVIEEEYDVEHGHPVGGENVSTIPLTRIQNLSWKEAREFAKKHGFDWPSTQEARDWLEDAVVKTIAQQDDKVVDAPTALGKSYTVATFPWLRHRSITGGAPVVHVHATREARDEAYHSSKKAGIDAKKVLGRKEACPVAAGEFDDELSINGERASEWIDRQCDGKGIPLSVAHTILAENNDQGRELPCSPGDSECPSKTQWRDVPWYNPGNDNNGFGGCGGVSGMDSADERRVRYDVVHATHPMLFVPSMTRDTNIVIDELPDYSLRVGDSDREGGLSMDQIQNAVTAYLQAIDAPVTNWEAFVTLARSHGDEEFGELYGALRDQYFELEEAIEERSPPLDWYIEEPRAHVLSRAVIECILDAFSGEIDRNGLRHGTTVHSLPRMDDEGARVRVSLVIDDDNRVKTIRQTPDLSGARSVVGLDAHPAMPLWRLNSVEHIERAEILDTDERRFWRLFERGLFAVQVGDATRPLSGDKAREWLGEEKLDVLLDDLVDEGLETAITTTQVERKLASLLSENGVLDPETMHYGEVRSRNDFGDEDVGFVNGCMDPGDGFVLTVLCEYECDAEPEQTECAGCSGEGCEECDETGHRRARGRGFTGPDADTAGAILASVRENEVAQAAGRYARNADDPDDRAVVYVRTDATPTGFADLQVGGVEWIATQKQVRIVESLQSEDWLSAKQIAADLDVSKRHVLKTLKKLRDQGVVDCRKGEGPYGADLYRAITGQTTSHLTDLGPSLSQGCELDGSMWSLIVEGADTVQQNAVYSSPEPDELSGGALGQFTSPPAKESVDTVSENITAFDRGESA